MGTKSASPWILYFLVTIPIRNTFVIFMNQLPVNINGFIILTHNRLLGGGGEGGSMEACWSCHEPEAGHGEDKAHWRAESS